MAAGGALWLSVILVLALLGEMGLPFTTCPIIESLLVFTGFQLVHDAVFVAVLPFLAVAYAGRLIGSTSAYKLSERVGGRFVQRYGGPPPHYPGEGRHAQGTPLTCAGAHNLPG